MKDLEAIAEQIVELVFADFVRGRQCELDWNATDKVVEILEEEFCSKVRNPSKHEFNDT